MKRQNSKAAARGWQWRNENENAAALWLAKPKAVFVLASLPANYEDENGDEDDFQARGGRFQTNSQRRTLCEMRKFIVRHKLDAGSGKN
jgi:hypothetical protein